MFTSIVNVGNVHTDRWCVCSMKSVHGKDESLFVQVIAFWSVASFFLSNAHPVMPMLQF